MSILEYIGGVIAYYLSSLSYGKSKGYEILDEINLEKMNIETKKKEMIDDVNKQKQVVEEMKNAVEKEKKNQRN